MSQLIIKDQARRGIEIQNHLEKIYSDVVFETFGKQVIDIVDTYETESTDCQACGYPETRIVWSEKYSGERGICIACHHNWPES